MLWPAFCQRCHADVDFNKEVDAAVDVYKGSKRKDFNPSVVSDITSITSTLTHNYEVLPPSYVTEMLKCTSKDMGYNDAAITDSRGSSCTGLLIAHRTLGPVKFQRSIATTTSLSTSEMQEKYQLRKDQPKEVLDRLNQKLMKNWPGMAKLHTHTPSWEEVQQKAAIFHKANADNKGTGDDESETTEIKRLARESSTDEIDVRAQNRVYAAEGPVSMEEREASNAKKRKPGLVPKSSGPGKRNEKGSRARPDSAGSRF